MYRVELQLRVKFLESKNDVLLMAYKHASNAKQ